MPYCFNANIYQQNTYSSHKKISPLYFLSSFSSSFNFPFSSPFSLFSLFSPPPFSPPPFSLLLVVALFTAQSWIYRRRRTTRHWTTFWPAARFWSSRHAAHRTWTWRGSWCGWLVPFPLGLRDPRPHTPPPTHVAHALDPRTAPLVHSTTQTDVLAGMLMIGEGVVM